MRTLFRKPRMDLTPCGSGNLPIRAKLWVSVLYASYSRMSFSNSYQMSNTIEVDAKNIQSPRLLVSFAKLFTIWHNAWIAPLLRSTMDLISVCVLEKFPALMVPDMILNCSVNNWKKSIVHKDLQRQGNQNKCTTRRHWTHRRETH